MPLEDTSSNFPMTAESRVSKPPSMEQKKKEPLSDEELGNLLAAIGNNEAKALTLLAMKKGSIYTERGLHSSLMELQGDIKGWNLDTKCPFGYCQHSFENIGLVVQGVSDQIRGTWGYIKTEYGAEKGDALAGLLLDFSLRHPDVSLYRIFGATSSKGKQKEFDGTIGKIEFRMRSPLSRIKLFWELVTSSQPLTPAMLGVATGVSSENFHKYLQPLRDAGLVHYEYAPQDQKYGRYQVSENAPLVAPPPRKGHPKQTKFVWDLLSKDPNRDWTLSEIVNAYNVYVNAQLKEGEVSEDKNRQYINSTLRHLEREGYVYNPGFSRERSSIAWVDERQRLILTDLLTIIYEFQEQNEDFIRRGSMLAYNFTNEEVSALMAKAKENSYGVSSVSQDVSKEEILEYLREHPASIVADIKKYLENVQNRKLSAQTVRSLISKIFEEGRVERSSDNVIKWSIKS